MFGHEEGKYGKEKFGHHAHKSGDKAGHKKAQGNKKHNSGKHSKSSGHDQFHSKNELSSDGDHASFGLDVKEDFDSLFDRSHSLAQKGHRQYHKKDNHGQSSNKNVVGSESLNAKDVKSKPKPNSNQDFTFNLDSLSNQPFGLDIEFTDE